MPHACRSMGTFPNVCTASTWKGTPCSRASAPMAATGWMVPISLLACITLMATVSGRSARFTSSGDTMPYSSTERYVTSKPWASSVWHVRNTAWCSIFEVMRWPRPRARASPFTPKLSDSVPPEVKTSSSGAMARKRAMRSRATSTASRAARPKPCTLDGFPKTSWKYGIISATTSG